MSRVRRAPKQLRSSVKIHILCEGETEEAHLGKILSSYRNVSIECFGGGGYGRAESEFDRNSKSMHGKGYDISWIHQLKQSLK